MSCACLSRAFVIAVLWLCIVEQRVCVPSCTVTIASTVPSQASTAPTRCGAMYFGTPSPQGKFYKGLSTDTPVNHVRCVPRACLRGGTFGVTQVGNAQDLHWRDRVVKENVMVKGQNKRRRQEVNPDMFVKRPWTGEEEQQLRDAVMRHGPNNWEVVCRDRTYIEMIGNHTMEDIKTKWRMIEKSRLRSRKQRVAMQQSASPGRAAPPRAATNATLNVLNQLKLKQTLQREAEKRADLADKINRERVARLEAEKKAALQMRERRKLEEKLRNFQKMAGSSGGANPVLRNAGSYSMLPSPQRQARVARPEDDSTTMMARLTSRSTAIQQSAATRLRARALLDSVREQRA